MEGMEYSHRKKPYTPARLAAAQATIKGKG